MKRVKLVVLIWAVLLPELAFADEIEEKSPVELEVSREGNSASVFLRATGDDVFLPACRGVVWERFVQPEDGSEGRYESITEDACTSSKAPIKVSKDGVGFSAPASAEATAGVLRAVVVVGLGCAPDRPMAVGGCSSLHSEISANITIASVVED